jgi:alpha-tubulin suppressor-like RCC1 family protein
VLLTGSLSLLVGCQDDVTAPEAMDQPPELAVASAAALSFRQVSTGGDGMSCGVTQDNQAYCWGVGFLGNQDAISQSSTPVAVAGGIQFKHLSVGWGHTCGVSTANLAYCWGSNSSGKLGDGTRTDRGLPGLVAGGVQFRQISAGESFTCAVAIDDRAYCWGGNTSSGQLGDGTRTDRLTPVPVSGGHVFSTVSAGFEHACGVTPDDLAYCWGGNRYGQLGDNSTADRQLVPTHVSDTRKYNQIDAGWTHTCAVTTGHRAFCWGDNGNGAVGDGTTISRWSPRPVKTDLLFSRVTAGSALSCGETTDNRGYCWGHAGYGQLGNGATSWTPSTTPVAVSGGLWFTQLMAGSFYSCGVTDQFKAYCWGMNDHGQVGDGTTENRNVPTAVGGA